MSCLHVHSSQALKTIFNESFSTLYKVSIYILFGRLPEMGNVKMVH